MKSFSMAVLLLCLALLLITPVTVAAQNKKPLYICLQGGKAVYSSIRLGQCQSAQIDGVTQDQTEALLGPVDEAQRQRYRQEYGYIDDNITIIPPRPKPAAHTPTIWTAAPPPPKLTSRQLIARDIEQEKQALQNTQQALSQARQNQQTDRVRKLSQDVADRSASIRALEEELKKHPEN